MSVTCWFFCALNDGILNKTDSLKALYCHMEEPPHGYLATVRKAGHRSSILLMCPPPQKNQAMWM